MAGKKTSTERKAFLLRLPRELHDELRAWAAQELRSLNGQIEFLLRDALKRAGRTAKSAGASAPDDSES